MRVRGNVATQVLTCTAQPPWMVQVVHMSTQCAMAIGMYMYAYMCTCMCSLVPRLFTVRNVDM